VGSDVTDQLPIRLSALSDTGGRYETVYIAAGRSSSPGRARLFSSLSQWHVVRVPPGIRKYILEGTGKHLTRHVKLK
jgi:hypothetical protein